MASHQHNWTSAIVIFCLLIVLILLPSIWRQHETLLQSMVTASYDFQYKHRRQENLPVYLWWSRSHVEDLKINQGHLENQTSSCLVSECLLGPVSINVTQYPVKLTLANNEGVDILKSELRTGSRESSYDIWSQNSEISLRIPETANVTIRVYKYDGSDCVDVTVKAAKCVNEVLTDCFHLGTAHWYGGSELGHQLWPLEKVTLSMAPYLAQEMMSSGYTYGVVQERFFFNSDGGGLYVEEDIPLFVSINASGDHQLCLQAKYDNYWYRSENNSLPELNYTMCLASDVKAIHQLMSKRFIKKPMGTPSHHVMKYPIWSTWAQYKKHFNQSLVEDFVRDIQKHNFSISQVEIDDGWSPTYGDQVFNSQIFPDPKKFVDFIHSQNIAVTLWVHPFVNIDSKAFQLFNSKNWLLRDISKKSPALASWWHGNTAGYIDFSNPDASAWFLYELDSLKQGYGIDSFKFDAGDVNFLPPAFSAHQQFLNRNHYTRLYAGTAYKADTEQRRLEVRTGARTQNLPVFVRILDRDSTWTLRGGLRSVITSGLCLGILGYPFFLPDYIGGNAYKRNPEPELFIRWVQANALMPVMQFSLLPWATNNITVLEVSQEMVRLHEKYSDLIIQLANESVITGNPIMRPLWWIAPTDEAALTVDDQFLVGNDLLVAPVVEQGQTIRTLYLPAGRWRDELKGHVYDGEKWINYPVTIRDLPYFTKVK